MLKFVYNINQKDNRKNILMSNYAIFRVVYKHNKLDIFKWLLTLIETDEIYKIIFTLNKIKNLKKKQIFYKYISIEYPNLNI